MQFLDRPFLYAICKFNFIRINILNPGYFMYIRKFYVLVTLQFMCFVWLSERTVTFALYVINKLVFITEAESVYSAIRTECLYNTDTPRP